jgi:hypothetical protein
MVKKANPKHTTMHLVVASKPSSSPLGPQKKKREKKKKPKEIRYLPICMYTHVGRVFNFVNNRLIRR